MTDAQFAGLLAALAGFFGGLAAFLKWMIDRILKTADNRGLSDKMDALSQAVLKLTAQLAHMEGKFDGIMDERERTPIGAPPQPPRRREDTPGEDFSGDDTPQIRPVHVRTPSRGVPYSYHNPRKKDE